MVENEQGQIAVRKYQTTPEVVRVGDGTEYAFSVRHNICLAWINPQHLNTVLSEMRECCGGSKKKVFFLADQVHTNRYLHGGR